MSKRTLAKPDLVSVLPLPHHVHVLVVDDEDMSRFVLCTQLKVCFYNVTAVGSARQALRVLERATRRFDLILVDLLMPELDGFELLQEIRKLDGYSDVPIIIISVSDDKSFMGKCVGGGADAYLVKPVEMSVIKSIWQHVWKREVSNRTKYPGTEFRGPVDRPVTLPLEEGDRSRQRAPQVPTQPTRLTRGDADTGGKLQVLGGMLDVVVFFDSNTVVDIEVEEPMELETLCRALLGAGGVWVFQQLAALEPSGLSSALSPSNAPIPGWSNLRIDPSDTDSVLAAIAGDRYPPSSGSGSTSLPSPLSASTHGSMFSHASSGSLPPSNSADPWGYYMNLPWEAGRRSASLPERPSFPARPMHLSALIASRQRGEFESWMQSILHSRGETHWKNKEFEMEPSLSSLVDPVPIRLKIRGRGARSRRWFGGLRLIVEPIQFLGADGAGGGAMSELPAGNSDMLGDPGVMSISPFLSAAAKLMAEVVIVTDACGIVLDANPAALSRCPGVAIGASLERARMWGAQVNERNCSYALKRAASVKLGPKPHAGAASSLQFLARSCLWANPSAVSKPQEPRSRFHAKRQEQARSSEGEEEDEGGQSPASTGGAGAHAAGTPSAVASRGGPTTQTKDVLVSVRGLHDKSGVVVMCVVVCVDVSSVVPRPKADAAKAAASDSPQPLRDAREVFPTLPDVPPPNQSCCLPDESMLMIASFLEAKDLMALALSSKSLFGLIDSSRALWPHLFATRWPDHCRVVSSRIGNPVDDVHPNSSWVVPQGSEEGASANTPGDQDMEGVDAATTLLPHDVKEGEALNDWHPSRYGSVSPYMSPAFTPSTEAGSASPMPTPDPTAGYPHGPLQFTHQRSPLPSSSRSAIPPRNESLRSLSHIPLGRMRPGPPVASSVWVKTPRLRLRPTQRGLLPSSFSLRHAYGALASAERNWAEGRGKYTRTPMAQQYIHCVRIVRLRQRGSQSASAAGGGMASEGGSRMVVCGTSGGRVRCESLSNPSAPVMILNPAGDDSSSVLRVESLSASPQETMISGSRSGAVVAWEPSVQQRLWVANLPTSSPLGLLAFDPMGTTAFGVCAEDPETVSQWSLKEGGIDEEALSRTSTSTSTNRSDADLPWLTPLLKQRLTAAGPSLGLSSAAGRGTTAATEESKVQARSGPSDMSPQDYDMTEPHSSPSDSASVTGAQGHMEVDEEDGEDAMQHTSHSLSCLEVYPHAAFPLLAGGHHNGQLTLWDYNAGRTLLRFATSNPITTLTFLSPSPNVLLSGHNDGSVKVWDLRAASLLGPATGAATPAASQPVMHLQNQKLPVTCLAACDGFKAASGGEDASLACYDLRRSGSDRQCLYSLVDEEGGPLTCLYMDTRGIAAGTATGCVNVWEFSTLTL